MFLIGFELKGYCDGYFGSEDTGPKRIEMCGCDWIVARSVKTGKPLFARFTSPQNMIEKFEKWTFSNGK